MRGAGSSPPRGPVRRSSQRPPVARLGLPLLAVFVVAAFVAANAALWWVALARQLSLEHYARRHGTRHAYTVESPVDDGLDDRVRIHLRAVAVFVRHVADEAVRAGGTAR
jgi:hypothetical protein